MIVQPHAWIEISTSALRHNVTQCKKLIGTNALAAVIKSNAYGHGLEPISKILDTMHDVDWLCVAMLSEALTLRSLSIKKPIIVMSCIDDNPLRAISLDIHFMIGSFEKLATLDALAQAHHTRFNVHLKIDTGLSRFGVMPEDTLEIINKITKMRGIHMSGICTHFAESYKTDQSFTLHQQQIFETIVSALKTKPTWIHAANSAGAIVTRINAANLCRIGLLLYGYWPSDFVMHSAYQLMHNVSLKPILTFKTRILEIKTIKKGTSVGYDRTYKAPHDMRIALLPIGYYDGYDFRLCNKTIFYIDENACQLVGKVAMNTVAIDITNSTTALIGTEVTIMGNMPGITAPEIAAHIGEPNTRKVTTMLGAHIPRIITL